MQGTGDNQRNPGSAYQRAEILLHQHGLRDNWDWRSDVHKIWYELSQPYLNPTIDEEDYLIEFMDRWASVRRKTRRMSRFGREPRKSTSGHTGR